MKLEKSWPATCIVSLGLATGLPHLVQHSGEHHCEVARQVDDFQSPETPDATQVFTSTIAATTTTPPPSDSTGPAWQWNGSSWVLPGLRPNNLSGAFQPVQRAPSKLA